MAILFNAIPISSSSTPSPVILRVTTTASIASNVDIAFCNTDSGGYTVTLPAGSEGDTMRVINSGASGHQLLVAPNGADDLLGNNAAFSLFDGEALQLTYNTTDGWY